MANGRYASGLTEKLGKEALEKVAASGVKINKVDTAVFKTATSGVHKMLGLDGEVEIVKKVLGK